MAKMPEYFVVRVVPNRTGFEIGSVSTDEVVPWEWLERYSKGMRMRYADEWVREAKRTYMEMNQIKNNE